MREGARGTVVRWGGRLQEYRLIAMEQEDEEVEMV